MTRLVPARTPVFTLALVLCISGAWFARGGSHRRVEGDAITPQSVFLVHKDTPVAEKGLVQRSRLYATGTVPRTTAAAALATRAAAAIIVEDCVNLLARAAYPGAGAVRIAPLPPRAPPLA